MNNIKAAVDSWRCSSCRFTNTDQLATMTENCSLPSPQEQCIELQPIGFISTGFVKKRAVPRQPIVNLNSHGRISLYNHVFTNPEHSLEGLDGFSHMW